MRARSDRHPSRHERGRSRWRGRAGAGHATVIAYVALFMAMSGTAVAATGGTFVLGRSNSASTVTTLTNSTGPALSLRAPAGSAPLQVNRTVKVEHLNADLLDGRDSTAFARVGATNAGARTTLSNPNGIPLRLTAGAEAAPLQVNSTVKVANLNADRLDGYDSADFVSHGAFEALQEENAALAAQVSDLEARNAELAARATDLRTRHDKLAAQVADIQTLVAGMSRTKVDGRDTLVLSGMNLQLVNGSGRTDGSNGLGNLVIGYNVQRYTGKTTRSGSHYLVVGDRHDWTSTGGIVAGDGNTAAGRSASVLGGSANSATGAYASVTGGSGNVASGWYASVTGGLANTASGDPSATFWTGDYTSVSGGRGNKAVGTGASILGGANRTVTGELACQPTCS